MSAPSPDTPSDDTTCCGCLHFSIFTKSRRIENGQPPIQRTGPSTALPIQSVDRVTKDSLNREAKDGNDAGFATISTVPPQGVSPSHSCDNSGAQGAGEEDFIPTVPTDAPKDRPSIAIFQGSSNFQISNTNITAIGNDATIIRFGDGEFTEVQRGLICDYIATLAVLPTINENLEKHILIQLIINLPRAEAVFNDYQTKKKTGPCFEGTRVALLKEMANWVTGKDESKMYVLSGLAGIGKSTVAYTIASRAADLNLLGASFFFSRDESDRNNAKKLFTTIAYQLCVYDEQFAKEIGDALQLDRGSAATTKSPQEQLQLLILDPLRSVVQSRARPILVVVDALDECCEEDIRAVIQGLRQLVRGLPSFKVILTTRPHSDIDYFLCYHDGHKLFHLQDIEDKIVDGDIRLYLKYNLSVEKVRERFPRRQWGASDEEIDSLVHAAGRLFIIASTSVRYILDKSISDPAAQMQELLCADAQNHTPFKDLNDFYTIILRNAVPVGCDNYKTINRYQLVVGAIILVQRPLPVSVLARLLDIDTEEIRAVLDHLQSVILLGDDDVPRVYHKSFPDYLMDKARCKESHLQIDPKKHHTHMAMRCFEIANEHLKYNILGLGTLARFMDNEDGLEEDGITMEKFEGKIPQQLCYGCIYWVTHFDAGVDATNIESGAIINGLDTFVNKHILHWFEVLSLVGKLDVAHHAIRIVLKHLNPSSNLHQLLSDALRFVSKFYDIINQSALHTYYSALPFSPTNSLLYRQNIKEAEHGICDIEGGLQEWNSIIADIGYECNCNIVKFSLNSTMVVSSCRVEADEQESYQQGWLKIWDAFTGTLISTIPGHRFAISNDFATVASSVDNVITCYNPDGSLSGTMFTTLSRIKKLALSSESDRISALLFDGTVCLWKSTNGDSIGAFVDGYFENKYCNLLEFCHFGTRLIYSSLNGVVKLLDGISGRFIADLQCGSDNKVKFFPNSSRIASLSKDSGLRLWNSKNGGLIAVADVVWTENCMAFAISANGSLLASTNMDHMILWSENCSQLTKIEILEFPYIRSIAFSQDNLLAISDLMSVKIYNIETRTMSTLVSGLLMVPVTFSPDGTRLVRGTLLFDTHAINTSGLPFRDTRAMALSRDCSRLACGFDDGTVELWGTSPGLQQIASHLSNVGSIEAVGFGPDSRLFASGSSDGIVNLWHSGDGSLHGTVNHGSDLHTVALSNSVLIVGGTGKLTLWDLGTLSHIHTFEISDKIADRASISDDGDLAVIVCFDKSVNLVDLTNRKTTHIATLEISGYSLQSLALLPDKSHLIVHSHFDELQSLNLINKSNANEHLLEHLIQFPSTPVWHGLPLQVYRSNGAVLRSPSLGHVPLLCVPTDHLVSSWALGSSMIALGLGDRRIILLRLRTS